MAPRRQPVLSKEAALALGIAGLLTAAWAFDQAWEARGDSRPWAARYLAV